MLSLGGGWVIAIDSELCDNLVPEKGSFSGTDFSILHHFTGFCCSNAGGCIIGPTELEKLECLGAGNMDD